jgi:hypothetical protein
VQNSNIILKKCSVVEVLPITHLCGLNAPEKMQHHQTEPAVYSFKSYLFPLRAFHTTNNKALDHMPKPSVPKPYSIDFIALIHRIVILATVAR